MCGGQARAAAAPENCTQAFYLRVAVTSVLESVMTAVVAALFSDHGAAERVRTRLVQDGFPTDRVELTSCQELGQAGVTPKEPVPEKLAEYFRQLFPDEQHRRSAQLLARGVLEGHAAIAVQPRGEIETKRALELLEQAGPIELRERDLEDHSLEHAASASEQPVVPLIVKILRSPEVGDDRTRRTQ